MLPLYRLTIRDFVIVDCLELEFKQGFSALAGETDAGVSILLNGMAVPLRAVRNDRAVEGVHGRKQRARAVPLAIVGHRGDPAFSSRAIVGGAGLALAKKRSGSLIAGKKQRMPAIGGIGLLLIDSGSNFSRTKSGSR